jgi:C-terminal processing protease CtpA/Prc
MEFLSTPLNNTRMEKYFDIPNLSESDKKEVQEALAKLNANLGKFVSFNDSELVFVQKENKVLPSPENVAIIINQNNGSTAEQFLLAAKQSKKTKLFGVTTMGVLDISNMYFVTSPTKEFTLGYCLSKSNRIPDMAIDGKGIMPDYYIDKTIPDAEWLNFVKNIMEQ